MEKEIEKVKEYPISSELLENEEEIEKKKKREVLFELALFLILGILLGITIKTEAVKRITIGFNDYKTAGGESAYNFDEIKKGLEQQAAAGNNLQQENQQ